MDLSRVVEILQAGDSLGSGYLITGRHVLTAAHVVKPKDIGTACMIRPLLSGPATAGGDEERPQPVAGKIGWLSAAYDLALVEISEPFLHPREKAITPFGQVPRDGTTQQIVASGFPAASGVDQRTIIGTLSWVLTGNRFDIDVISAIPRDWRKWGGFSGAAIFANNLLVGVTRTVDENWNGGVLEATPAMRLLDDSSFISYLQEAGLPTPSLIDAGAADMTVPLDFDMDVATTSFLRFSPRNPRVPFIGREAELQTLDEFLFGERERPFAWWLVTGGGGAGKTRLARELCLSVRKQGWRAGFLPRSFQASASALDAWCPTTPNLIVADYVMTRIAEIRTLAARLARRNDLPPVRLLLLEREAGPLFENQLLGSDQSDRGVIEKARHATASLTLAEIAEDEIWSIVQACPWRDETAQVPLPRDQFFQRLSQLDRQRRPLVAMILADALASSLDRAGLGGLEKELRELLRRDREHLWPEEIRVAASTAFGKSEAEVAIAFATMVDGLGPADLETIGRERSKPLNPEILPACGIAIGKPLGSVPHLGRLEPDLIGEFFALETLCRDQANPNPFAELPNTWMPATAWRSHGSEMFDFVARSKQNFPKHDAIQRVEILVEGVRESWLLAAFGVLSKANYSTTGFHEVHAWLLPHAMHDVGAALAFADITLSATVFEYVAPSAFAPLVDSLNQLQKAHAGEQALQERIAIAIFNKGVRLGALDRSEDEIAAYDDLIARFGDATELPLREVVAGALSNKRAIGRNSGPTAE